MSADASTIDHEAAASIARGLGSTYTSPSDDAVRTVFDAYLALRNPPDDGQYLDRASLLARIETLTAERDIARQAVAVLSTVPGLAESGPYTLADVEAIEAHRGKPYARLRETVMERDAAKAQLVAAELRARDAVEVLKDASTWARPMPKFEDEWREFCARMRKALAAATDAGAWHADDSAVTRFAEAMRKKLSKKRDEGRGGWEDERQVSGSELSQMLFDHVLKGDPVDVANFAMMLHQRRERIDGAWVLHQRIDAETAPLRERIADLEATLKSAREATEAWCARDLPIVGGLRQQVESLTKRIAELEAKP